MKLRMKTIAFWSLYCNLITCELVSGGNYLFSLLNFKNGCKKNYIKIGHYKESDIKYEDEIRNWGKECSKQSFIKEREKKLP